MSITLGSKTLCRLMGTKEAVDFVTEQISIGGNVRNWRLQKAGITHVLNNKRTKDAHLPKDVIGFHNPTIDDGKSKGEGRIHMEIDPQSLEPIINGVDPTHPDAMIFIPELSYGFWANSVEWALDVLKDPDAKLYVHCSAGMHRSPGTVYAILRAQGYKKKKAWKMITHARSKVSSLYVDDVDSCF